MRIRPVGMVVFLLWLSGSAGHAQLSAVLGTDAVTLDTAKVNEVKAGAAGTRYYYDTDGDGKIEECWFIDIDPRHTSAHKPMLVKAIDKDGDMAVGKEPDQDSDIYIADWNANGTADTAVILEDYDHDNDVDAMATYYPPTTSWWWGRDDGDDNLLWWDRDYTYSQDPCQEHTHFGGDETFFSALFNSSTRTFSPRFEAPFYFYDNNGDGRTDEVVRVTVPNSSSPNLVQTLRWSFNVDANGTDVDFRNYDCSISAHPLGNTLISGENAVSTTLYGYPFTPLLSRETCRTWLKSLTWSDGLFTWVENNNNVGWATGGNYAYHEERWEGVIAHPATGFAQIGGPTCGPYNNRYELITAPAPGPFEYYYNPADRRIHLKKANSVWLETDWDSSWAGDMKYTWTDTNADGYVDRIAFDVDDNGTADDTWDISTSQVQALDFTYQAFHDAYMPVLQTHPAQLYDLDRALAAALESVSPGSSADAVWTLVNNRFSGGNIAEWKRQKFLASDRALAYYLELVRDRQILKLKAYASGSTSFWTSFNAARTAGDTTAMRSLLGATFGPSSPDWTPFAAWIADLRAQDVQRVDASAAWLPGGIAWETEQAAWRIIGGRCDFLGKRAKSLVLGTLTPSTSISTDSGGWGMDALDEGSGPGAGGLTLFVNGAAYPLYGDALTSASYRVLEQTNARVTVEMVAGNVGPVAAPRRVRVLATAEAGRADTRMQAVVEGGPAGDTIALGIGLTLAPDNQLDHRPADGILGIREFQSAAIGWVNLGVIYEPACYLHTIQSATEIDLVLAAARGRLVNWTLQHDWVRGRRFSMFPVLTDWMGELDAASGGAGFPVPLALVWVDFYYGGAEFGTEAQPYRTFGRGVWGVTGGGTIKVKAGRGGESARVTKQVRVESSGGAATIGR
ncbi:MAG: DUF4861 family protein [Candidatus Sumerlaeia bacterium]